MATFKEQIKASLPRLRRFTAAMTGSVADGDDLMQMTVERAIKSSHTFDAAKKMESWLFKIAQNIWIDEKRSQARKGTHEDLEAQTHLSKEDGRITMEQRNMTKKVIEAIGTLPEDQRAIVALVLVDGYSYKEASAMLDVPIGTVMSRLARARAKLQAEILGTDLREGQLQ